MEDLVGAERLREPSIKAAPQHFGNGPREQAA